MWKKKIALPLNGSKTTLRTKSGLIVATGYSRVVIGKRGPYVEIPTEHIVKSAIYIPTDQLWRMQSEFVYYVEYRSKNVDYAKIYHQKKKVSYADYRIGFWYISPFDLLCDDYHIWSSPPKKSPSLFD